jgi:hypothetical protein
MYSTPRGEGLNPIKRISHIAIAGAIAGILAFPLGAAAHMRTIDAALISHLDQVTETNFLELYEHQDLASYPFTHIYIEPVTNQMRREEIYAIGLRPYHYDALAEDFRARLVAAFEGTNLLTNEPDDQTLVISTAITDVVRFQQQTTGTHLTNVATGNLLRGGTIMEMVWRAGPGGEIILAIRDGRTMELNDPITDRSDRFTDSRDNFDAWASDLAAFFGITPSNDIAMNW